LPARFSEGFGRCGGDQQLDLVAMVGVVGGADLQPGKRTSEWARCTAVDRRAWAGPMRRSPRWRPRRDLKAIRALKASRADLHAMSEGEEIRWPERQADTRFAVWQRE